MEALCKRLAGGYELCAITNDIYTKEDAEILTRVGALPPERIMGVETGGCSHTAIPGGCSMNLAAGDTMIKRFPHLDLVLLQSGGGKIPPALLPPPAGLPLSLIDVSA